MIQDIAPKRLYNEYRKMQPKEGDALLFFDEEGKALVKAEGESLVFPKIPKAAFREDTFVYLFSLDERHFFLSLDPPEDLPEGFAYQSIRQVRDLMGQNGSTADTFVVFTAYHLWKWYADNRFCGKCGAPMTLHEKERALACPSCKHVVYPRINPAVIVGVKNGDSLLLTRYRTGYGHNALVAGFTEIGETLEETVKREVMEEAGLKVKNIRYHKSQPWGMAQDILAGFYCEVDGDPAIHMDEGELKYAQWVKREDIELQPNNLSLTNEMMRRFKEGIEQ